MANQGSQVDRLVTQNFDLHGRRAVNAAASKSPTDYVIQDELTAATSYKTLKKFIDKVTALEAFAFSKVAIFIGAVTFRAAIIVSILRPLTDSTTAIKITKANGTTAILTIDSTNAKVGLGIQPDAKLDVKDGVIRASDGTNTPPVAGKGAEVICTGSIAYFIAYDRTGAAYIPLNLHGSTVTITGNLAFFGGTPVAQLTLAAYASNSQNSAYASTPAALAQAATLVDLNALRVAYETLRASYDDLRTKLKATTLVL